MFRKFFPPTSDRLGLRANGAQIDKIHHGDKLSLQLCRVKHFSTVVQKNACVSSTGFGASAHDVGKRKYSWASQLESEATVVPHGDRTDHDSGDREAEGSRESHGTASQGSLKGLNPPAAKDRKLSRISMTAGEQIRRVERARKAIYAGWYNDPALPETWCTDWDKWETSYFWVERAKDGKLKIDKLFKETWKLPGIIELLAFMPGSCGEYFLFTAGGRYYFYADRQLTVHDMEFGSAEKFLKYLTAKDAAPGSRLPKVEVPRQPGTDFRWW
ncbi:hypothetical protein C8R45DRAFT_938778 [Mycena sanguinolenta]|nr:hypothetical protein C8R45DRAFT_938778 [Mycena sanguinolenta]